MDNPLVNQGKDHSIEKMAERIAKELESLSYRWGYFQGAILIPWSLLIILSVVSDLVKPHHDPWYLAAIGLLMGFLGFPLAYGLLRKTEFSFALLYAMFGLSLLLLAIKVPIAIRHYSDPGDNGSAFFEAELLLIWLLSLLYYRRRKLQFH